MGAVAGYACSVAFCLFSVLFPCLSLGILFANRENVDSADFKQRYSTLVDRLSSKSLLALSGQVVSMLRLLISVIIIVLLRAYPAVQILSLLALATVYQFYLLRVRPYEEPRDNAMALINEALISAYLYVNMVLTDFNTKGLYREQAATLLLGILLASIGINLLDMLYRIAKKAWPKVRAKLCPPDVAQKSADLQLLKSNPLTAGKHLS